MRLADINKSDRYAVDGYGGVAFYFAGKQTEMQELDFYDGDGWMIDTEEVDTGMVYMIMVGDDHKHVIDPEDVIKIKDEDYCHECGQIGCTHDGR